MRTPAAFASLSGRIDAIAHMKREAKQVQDSKRVAARTVCHTDLLAALLTCAQAETIQKAAGTAMRAAMMVGNKRKEPSAGGNSELTDKENEETSGSTRGSKRLRKAGRSRPGQQISDVVDILRTTAEKQDFYRDTLIKQNELLIEQHRAATTSYNTNQAALLELLREGLLGPKP
jgi:hypothetical protein